MCDIQVPTRLSSGNHERTKPMNEITTKLRKKSIRLSSSAPCRVSGQ